MAHLMASIQVSTLLLQLGMKLCSIMYSVLESTALSEIGVICACAICDHLFCCGCGEGCCVAIDLTTCNHVRSADNDHWVVTASSLGSSL